MRRKVLPLAALIAGLLVFQWMQYDFKTLDGEQHKWRQLQGQWLVINYFAEWCSPCLKEIPELNALHTKIRQNPAIQLFGVSYDQLDDTQLSGLKQRYDINFPLISGQPVMPNPHPMQLPTTYIIAPDGQVARQLVGEQSCEGVLQVIAALQGT